MCWPEAGRGSCNVGRLRLRLGGFLVLGLAAGTARAARFAVDSVTAIHRVKGACHLIVVSVVASVAADHGLPDW